MNSTMGLVIGVVAILVLVVGFYFIFREVQRARKLIETKLNELASAVVAELKKPDKVVDVRRRKSKQITPVATSPHAPTNNVTPVTAPVTITPADPAGGTDVAI